MSNTSPDGLKNDLSAEMIEEVISLSLPEETVLFGIEFVECVLSLTVLPQLRILTREHPSKKVRGAAAAAVEYLQALE